MPVPEVIVESVQIREVQPYIDTTGTTQAFEFVEIPARVTGFLREVRYTPGDLVLAGAPLFLIQPEQYQAEVKSAEGSLASAQAQIKLMEANLARTKQLFDEGAATQQDLDTDSAHRDEATAAVIRAEADLETARLNLSYTDVRSPIVGKVDRNFIDVGNMVGPNSTTLPTNGGAANSMILTTVAGMDPIYVYFDISDSQFNDMRKFAKERQNPEIEKLIKRLREIKETRKPKPENEPEATGDETSAEQTRYTLTEGLEEFQIEFEIGLIKGSEPGMGEYPYKGIIDMASNTIDPSTGTITIRGEIPNTDYEIFPGQICRVRVPVWPIPDAVLVRQEAVGTDLNQRYVYVVDEKNIAHRRVVELGSGQKDGTRVVTQGLEKGERYVVDGIQKVRDGAEVKIVEAKIVEAKTKNPEKTAKPSDASSAKEKSKDDDSEKKIEKPSNTKDDPPESVGPESDNPENLPAIIVSATYPGADPELLEEAVVKPLENQINGVDGMSRLESACEADGKANIVVTFQKGVDPQKALDMVSNRVKIAEPLLPQEVSKQGITVKIMKNSSGKSD